MCSVLPSSTLGKFPLEIQGEKEKQRKGHMEKLIWCLDGAYKVIAIF